MNAPQEPLARLLVSNAISLYPLIFGISAFPGWVFKINGGQSYIDAHGVKIALEQRVEDPRSSDPMADIDYLPFGAISHDALLPLIVLIADMEKGKPNEN